MNRCPPPHKPCEDGFTLIELIAALVSASLLMITVGYVISELSTDWTRTSRAQQPEQTADALATTRTLLSRIYPLHGEDGLLAFEGDGAGLSAPVLPPDAVTAIGPLRLKLYRKQTGSGVALAVRLEPAAGTLATMRHWPDMVFEERILIDGLEDVRFSYVAKPEDIAEPLDRWPESRELPLAVRVAVTPSADPSPEIALWVAPDANVDGRCLFDPISADCRL